MKTVKTNCDEKFDSNYSQYFSLLREQTFFGGHRLTIGIFKPFAANFLDKIKVDQT